MIDGIPRRGAQRFEPHSKPCTAGLVRRRSARGRRSPAWCRRIGAALLVLLAATPAAAQGSFVNWESPPIHPVDMTPDGATLLVVNTADDRLEVFTLGSGLPAHVASIPVGL